MKKLILIILLWVSPLSLFAQEIQSKTNKWIKTVSIPSGAVKELCFSSKKNDNISYRFNADKPLEFNLHYHTDKGVFYPVPEHATASEEGKYVAPTNQTYCLMWTNNQDVIVNVSTDVEGGKNIFWY